MMPVLTQWFPASVRPTRVGFYIVALDESSTNGIELAFWNGAFWHADDFTRSPLTHWQGLAFDPAAAQWRPRFRMYSYSRLKLEPGWWVPVP